MANRVRRPSTKPPAHPTGYEVMLGGVIGLLEQARRAAARSVNAVLTATYWEVGRRIVKHEQHGAGRAGYGAKLLTRLADDLTGRFGRGFSRQNLQSMRAFYLAYPGGRQICQTASGKSRIRRIAPGESEDGQGGFTVFPLPWSHYVRLLAVKSGFARQFYETEALRGGWTLRQLDRQIASSFYERTAMSRRKASMLEKGSVRKAGEWPSAEEEVKDPFVLEFLGLKDEYSESDIEEGMIRHLESFLLELGGDFAFVGRQRRLRVGDQWYRIDLLFFHRRLRCLVIIDLKSGPLTHADAGQMHLYCNYALEHWTNEGENPPVGLILCEQRDAAVAHYARGNLPNEGMAAEYRMVLPDEELIAEELNRTRKLLEDRGNTRKGMTRRRRA